jgi:hypothetical protein
MPVSENRLPLISGSGIDQRRYFIPNKEAQVETLYVACLPQYPL